MTNNRPSATPGTFVISLDFELMWGVRDLQTKETYGANVLGARLAIPAMLALFEEFGLHVTWATVGLLFFGARAGRRAGRRAARPTPTPTCRTTWRYPGLASTKLRTPIITATTCWPR